MDVARAGFYAESAGKAENEAIVAQSLAIRYAFASYGDRRVDAERRHRDGHEGPAAHKGKRAKPATKKAFRSHD